jgi:hypothetical protein
MNNRLGDLPDWAMEDDEEEEQEEGKDEQDIEKGKVKSKQEVDKEIFFAAVEQIKNEITQVQRAAANIQKINEEAQKATTTEKEQELSKKLRKEIENTNKQAKAAKNLLGELKNENEQLKKNNEVAASDMR